ncbi:hypothetical protein BTN50_1778 (plasmid) [Candidatus Enterovibrio altilux]|uniref:Uncharacterized protein n=1 Tax=Candidatus Enterovibrio altilux TaxID=1927128 RepID=A0A291BB40_9GAMM|nr:hypothetical protein BTN50_1778 [Candidatus Enterovibrio luxaltus]
MDIEVVGYRNNEMWLRTNINSRSRHLSTGSSAQLHCQL